MNLTNECEPRFYVIVRNDLYSMTAGRAAAQVSHAANHMVRTIEKSGNTLLKGYLEDWEKETPQHFGTAIVLQAPYEELLADMQYFKDFPSQEFTWAMTHDPEYSVQDGDWTHIVPLDTCLWIFGNKYEIENHIASYQLL